MNLVQDFSRKHHIIINQPTFEEGTLTWMNEIREHPFETVADHFRQNFVRDIAQADWQEILKRRGMWFFGN